MKCKFLSFLLINFLLVLTLIATDAVFAREGNNKNKKKNSLSKVAGDPSATRININNISTWIVNDGNTDYNLSTSASGFEFPKGSGKTAIYASGFVWGGSVVNEGRQFRVGGSTYEQGLIAGRILPNGEPADPSSDDVRIYRVRRDYKKQGADFSAEMKSDGGSAAEIYDQYDKDWNEWPADQGAPYEDIDGNGLYDPTVDIPGFIGADQTVWFVANDFDDVKAQSLYGSPSMGVEMQATIWGYKIAGPLGSTIFRKYTLINKSSSVFDSMYVAMWSDPDLGEYTDDFVGCDTTLSLGFVYNGGANDATYGTAVPAAGFDFFQGPIVPGEATDSAIFKGKRVYGKKNLPMTTFFFFISGDPVYQDPELGNYQGTIMFRRLMEGKVSTTGDPFVDPTTGQTTHFALAGDPVAPSGWVDGILHQPDDRRLGQVSGPFVMAPGDTQEVVIAEIVAQAGDRLSSVTLLKSFDLIAQATYDNFFNIAKGAPEPIVAATPYDNKVVLSWGNPNFYPSTEGYVGPFGAEEQLDYFFQGYNVYQLPTATTTLDDKNNSDPDKKPVLIATYDLVDGIQTIYGYDYYSLTGQYEWLPLQLGKDIGLKRSIELDQNYLSSKAGLPLNNGSPYYYAVTSYSYSADPLAVPNVLENPFTVITVVPQQPNPGVTYEGTTGQSLEVAHTGGSDGSASATVVDPAVLNGHKYQVSFGTNTDGNVVWNLKDVTANKDITTNMTNQSGDADYPIVDGLLIKVEGPPNDFKNFLTVANAAGPLDPFEGAAADFQGFPVPSRPGANQQVGDGKWMFHTGDNGGSGDGGTRGSYEAFLSRSMRGSNFSYAVPYDWEMRFTAEGSYAIKAFQDEKIIHVPFELWNVGINTPDDPSDDYKVIPWILDSDEDGTYNLANWGSSANGGGGDFEHSVSGGDNDPYTDWIYWRQPANTSAGTAGYDAYVAAIDLVGNGPGSYDYSGHEVIARSVLVNFNGGSAPPFNQDLPEQGTIFRLVTTKPNSTADVFEFTAPTVSESTELAKANVENINVFPNPYYGVNSLETKKYYKFVTFSHLPQKATIRIFNLAGQLVRTIDKTEAGQFEEWDLLNHAGLPVASGIYIAHIDMPDLGKTKILKLAIIQEQQVLDRF
ncbi:MAG: hypothetical protein HYS25_03325 [Ignavibacteriales bacterium]|nr:hypothetical protein [Ignavibacteriales bacterium]